MKTPQPNENSIKPVWHSFTNTIGWSWFRKIAVLIIFSLIVNHLATRDSFPDSEQYRFPLEGFLSSIILGVIIGVIADFNFKFYEKKYFSKKVEIRTIVWFMATTLGYITLIYIPVFILLNIIAGGNTEFYFLLIGLLLTLLISFIGIGLIYAQDLYNLYKLSIKDAEITIESGAKTTKLTYENIACFYSENKIVYTIQNNGTSIPTDFTLNELEEKINDQLFFRANRQIIIHKEAVEQIEKIENGKLRIRLKIHIENDVVSQINISRYKRKEFMSWIQ